jgi:alpha,alpha-trehalase
MFEGEHFLRSELFERVQMQRIFSDSKVFADAIPRHSYAAALNAYAQNKPSNEALFDFVTSHFKVREANQAESSVNTESALNMESFIESTWAKLIRPADRTDLESTLLPLPFRYLVPGGRFQEIYYWDTYFTALGLIESKQHLLVKEMLDNFVHLQQSYGLIPNGNRIYYLSRSQPPILALLVGLLRDNLSTFNAIDYLPNLIQEHNFWVSANNNPRSLVTESGFIASRYWDNLAEPRPESLLEDIELAEHMPEEQRGPFFRHLRAACESGWDFSSRWLAKSDDLKSIRTTDIVPVDLNALLGITEQTISELAEKNGQLSTAKHYAELRSMRQRFFREQFWQSDKHSFCDLTKHDLKSTGIHSLACVAPLFAQLASPEQAHRIAIDIGTQFLHDGGLATTLNNTQQQWDYPNAWAPLQWFAVQGLKHYGYDELAAKISRAWLSNIQSYYNRHGVMMEKYNVVDIDSAAKGGEYDVQLGFGWTNGVTLALNALLKQ